MQCCICFISTVVFGVAATQCYSVVLVLTETKNKKCYSKSKTQFSQTRTSRVGINYY